MILTRRVYDQALTYDPAKQAWILPAGAADVVLYVNGLRYKRDADYSLTAAPVEVKALADNMPADALVLADYDLP